MSGAILTLVICTLGGFGMAWWARRDAAKPMTTTYGSDLRTLRSNWLKLGVVLGLVLFVSAPIGFSWLGYRGFHLPAKLIPGLPLSEFGLSVLTLAGIFAIGTLALNMLTGFAGQVSLGHASLIGIGAYGAGYFGQQLVVSNHHLPFLVWIVLAGLLGALISAVIGPFALRLRGDYLAVISVGLLVFSEHVFNAWADVTGGTPGRTGLPQPVLAVAPGKSLVFSLPETGETEFFKTFLFTRNMGYFWLAWAFVVVAILVARNVVRSRQGRAMMAVRDRDVSAEAIGIDLSRTKVKAFALCGGLAGISGALYGAYIQSITPEFFNLNLSIQYVAMMIVGGAGTITGSVFGALLLGSLDRIFDRFRWIFSKPVFKQVFFFVTADGNGKGMKIGNFVRMVSGLAIVVFLIFFPQGIVALWERFKRFVRRWPFAS
jgi:branched-chain amino acid transport system permease protein